MAQVVLPDMTVAAHAGQGMPPPPNLLTMAQQGVGIQGQMLQNQLARNTNQEFQSKLSAGRDFQQAIGPNGQLDPTALNSNLANDPNAAYAAPQMSQTGQTNLTTQLQNAGMTLDQAQSRLKFVSNALGQLLLPGAKIDNKAIMKVVTDTMQSQHAPAKDAAQLLMTVPPDSDPAAQKAWVQQHYAMVQGSVQALQQHVAMLNAGAKAVPVNTNTLAGPAGAMPGNDVQIGLSPGQAATPVNYNVGKTPVTTTEGQIAASGNQLPTTEGAAPVVEGLTPAQQTAQAAQGTQSSNMGTALVQDASKAPEIIANLQSINAEGQQANPGPIAPMMAKFAGVMGQFGIHIDQATAAQLTTKSTMQLVGNATQAMGVPTDGKMLAMEMATPNVTMTPQAISAASGMLMGAQEYKVAKANAWTQFSLQHGADTFPQFQQLWNKNVPNAAVFQLQYLPAAQRQSYLKSLSPTEQKQFASAFTYAKNNGMLGQ